MNNTSFFSVKKNVSALGSILMFLIANLEVISQTKQNFILSKTDKNLFLFFAHDKLQKIQTRNDVVNLYVFIVSLVVLVLFMILFYNCFRLKKIIKEQLEIKNQEITKQNELTKKMFLEKEWLLKEIHHRVKNNLQIVISLLNTQSAYLDNEDALIAIQNSKHRMQVMSIIHQKLYQSDNLANIDMDWYIFELINYIKDCFDIDDRINFILDIEKVYLDVSQAVPLGLIINEAINNSIKYAFPFESKGTIHLLLKNTEEDNYKLIIADNGVGITENFDGLERNSLGMNLIIGLSNQIDGTLAIINDDGLQIKLTFTKNTEFEEPSDNSEIV
ncbi:sensor histidine kinase [Flavobacterium limi]|nr:sensor histidine kinase [Flavobacterium limi]